MNREHIKIRDETCKLHSLFETVKWIGWVIYLRLSVGNIVKVYSVNKFLKFIDVHLPEWIILWRQQEYSRFFIHQLSDHRGRSQFTHFSFRDCKTFSIHLEEYGCMANLWNYSTLSSLPYPCLTPPPSYFSTLPPPYFTPLPSPPSASFILRFDFLCFNTNLECFLFVRTDRPDHFYHNENFTFNQNCPARSLSHILNSLH